MTRARRYIRHIVEQATRGPLPSDLVEIAEEIRLGDQLTLRDLLEDPTHEATLAQLARRNQPSARRAGAVMRPGNSG